MKNYLLFSILFLLSIQTDFAQQYRQVDKNLNVFYKLNPNTKISLFFNQPGYLPGDTAYFLTRFVNAVDLKPIKKKSILHLILVDKSGKKACDQFFLIEDGIASNQLVIPPTLPAGIYRLLCLREQINNNIPALFYQQNFEIIGANKNIVVDTVRSISISPEGGSILADVENKIFVSVRPATSLLLTVSDGLNHHVGSLRTNSNGIGFFSLKPTESQTFYLSGTVKGKSIRAALPALKQRGANFNAIIANGKLKVTGKVIGFHGKPEILLIRNDRVCYAEKLKLDSLNKFSFEMPLGETLKGLFQLWIVDLNSVLGSRVLYCHDGDEDEILKIKHPLEVHPRTKIEVLLAKADSLLKGTFSVRVYRKSLFPQSKRNIFSDLELFNDLPPSSPFQSELAFDSINDFLATQQWHRYDIDSLANGKFNIKKVSFDRGFIISGKCIGIPVLNSQQRARATLYFENSNFLEEVEIDKNGNFSLTLTEPIALHEKVYYRIDLNETELTNAKLEIEDVNSVLPAIQTRTSNEHNVYYPYQVLADSIKRSYAYFTRESKALMPESTKHRGLEAKTYGANKEYNLNEYLVFSTMKDVIVEILGKVAIKKINGKNAVRIYLEDLDKPDPVLAKADPLFIIDGIPTNDTDFFLGLNPSKVEKIRLIWKGERSVLKSFGRNGVIIVETKRANFNEKIPALNSFNATGFSYPLPFGVPPNLNDNRYPYFKSCLYWDPVLKFDHKGSSRCSFFASDDLGEYTIDVEGLTVDGIPYFNRSSFEIVPEK